jgi:hypothetical protein
MHLWALAVPSLFTRPPALPSPGTSPPATERSA